jgi:hypothetical protein
MNDFRPIAEKCTSWNMLYSKLGKKHSDEGWLYRGGCERIDGDRAASLQSSLEREHRRSTVELKDLPAAEKEMIRDFKRKYDGDDRMDVENDDLYCLSIMRHYGAPTRLLDWTYSPDIAAYFALERWEPKDRPEEKLEIVVWCLNQDWCYKNALKTHEIVKCCLPEYRKAHESELSDPIARQTKRDLFRCLFMQDMYKFVFPVNTAHLHERLRVQQGAFLCPGDVGVPLIEILASYKYDIKDQIIRLSWAPDSLSEYLDAMDNLYRMNINRVSLFPGLDGLAQSLICRLDFYSKMSKPPRKCV